MTEPVTSKHAIASFRRFYTLLPKSDDVSLVILKLHLLVEEQVRAYVDERIRAPEALSAAKLDCHQVICLAEGLAGDTINPRLWEVAKKLNELRNKIAHNLEPNGVIERMRNINSMLGQNLNGSAAPSEVLDQFNFSILMLYSTISSLVQRKSAEVLRFRHPEDAP